MRNGDYVKRIPPIAHGDPHHPACDNGYVASVGNLFVHVIFPGQYLVEPCSPKDLVPLEAQP